MQYQKIMYKQCVVSVQVVFQFTLMTIVLLVVCGIGEIRGEENLGDDPYIQLSETQPRVSSAVYKDMLGDDLVYTVKPDKPAHLPRHTGDVNRPVDMYHTPTDFLKCTHPLQDGSPYYEDVSDCNCYFVCSKRRNAIKMCCPSGLWWDQVVRRCLFAREFSLRKQARCLQLTRRKVLARARSKPEDGDEEENKVQTEENTDSDQKKTDKKSADLTLDRYYSYLPQEYIYGHCSIQPNPGVDLGDQLLWGSVDFRQSLKGGATELRVNVTGFNVEDNSNLHGVHIHEYGDLSKGCQSAGGHYDPFGVVHGGPRDSPQFRHFGDLGNLEEDSDGNVDVTLKDYLVSLLGPFSVLGRAVVIHEREDDLGRGNSEDSLLTGSAGRRLACCTIGLSDGARWS